MQILNTIENEPVTLKPEYLALATSILKNNPSLPFKVNNGRIVFDDYIIGSLKLDDLVINIESRHGVFSLNKVFEMMLYNSKIKSNILFTDSYSYSSGSGISILPLLLIKSCNELVKFGLTGGYVHSSEYSKELKGTIDFSSFDPRLIGINGLKVSYDTYSLDTLQNQVIKAALSKANLLLSKNESLKVKELLKHFDEVSEYIFEEKDEDLIMNFFSSNTAYKETLKLSIIVLKDLKLSYKDNDVEWYSFLTNSNDLFETFARNVIKNTISESVEKWDKAKEFGSISYNGTIGYKSYVPDILINYNQSTESASAVIDAKNKSFKPQNSKPSELVLSEDIYQLLFYLRQLKTKVGALIYPTNENYEPIKFVVNDSNDYRIYLLSINFNSSISDIEAKIKKDLYSVLLKI